MATAGAQEAPLPRDSDRAQIHTALRAFYYHLARNDWEALTDHILSAKVLASRTTPQKPTAAAGSHRAAACDSRPGAFSDQATIILSDDWAEVSVPRCTMAAAGADEFRLVRFENRWRFVYIDLLDQSVDLSADR
jgi:hypothetical protein